MKALLCWLGIFVLPLVAIAQMKPGEAATIESVQVKGYAVPGGRVTAVVKVKLAKGYHVHSNKPFQPEFIPTVVKVGVVAGIKVGNISYPEGISERVKGLEKPLSVFEDHFEISIPLGLGAAVNLPASVPATLSYQACQGAICYKPQELKFEIPLTASK